MPPPSIQQRIEPAIRLLQAGSLPEAESLFRQILADYPDNPDALHLLGCTLSKLRRPDEAVELIRRAIAANPRQPLFYNNLGLMLRALDRRQEAVAAYRQAIALNANFAEAFNNLGKILEDIKDRDGAIACYNRAATIRPAVADYHYNLGNARLHKALALPLKSAQRARESESAIASFRQALAIQKDHSDAAANLGYALQESGRREEAIAVWRQSAAMRPHANTLYNLGLALSEKDQIDEAIAAISRAIELNPDFAEAHNNLANVFKDRGQLDEAIAGYDRAIAARPQDPIFASNRLYVLYYHPAFDSAAILREHQAWNERMAHPLRAFVQPHANVPSSDRRLRIGYVSSKFWEHCQAMFTGPLFFHHNHQDFEVFCYSDSHNSDAFTARLRGYADAWRDIVRLDDERAAQLIREDRIDVLVDLTLHMSHNRLLLFARKPAPVQVTWLGYPGTTGLETMDYRLTDPYLDPPGDSDRNYSEKSIRLPNTFWCYNPRVSDSEFLPDVNPLPAQQAGFITFGCLNNFCKVNQSLLNLWKKVLAAVPKSRLLLLAPPGSRRDWVTATLGDRVDFVPRQPRGKYLDLYRRIDLGLDTLPYNGHTTTLDSLWMGVPVVTLIGPTVVGRAGWSQLSNLGLTELAAKTEDQFISIAAQLAADLPRLTELRRTLRDRMTASPLMDAQRFARDMESAYRQMWRQWCEEHPAR